MSDTQQTSGSNAGDGKDIAGREFLAFTLGSEEYGIDILKVQEIRGYQPPTRIANVPPFIKGVTNLRGVIVPIVDLRIKLNMEIVEYNDFTVVIVLNIAGRTMGIVVDSVSDVLTIAPESVKPVPEFSGAVDAACITGLGTLKSGDDERMLILVDIERMMTGADMALM